MRCLDRVDILINNAGISKHEQMYPLSPDEAEHVMRVDFLSAVWTRLAAIPEGLWLDQAGSNIRALIVKPGPIDTGIWDKEDEPAAYNGPKDPTRIVVDATFEVVEKRLREVTAPKMERAGRVGPGDETVCAISAAGRKGE